MTDSYFLRPPQVWSPAVRDSRRTTWTELFYDLVFAAVISQVGSPLATDYSLRGITSYAMLLTLVFLAWLGYTTFSTQFASEDALDRVFIIAQIFLVAVMAANANQSLKSRDAAGFAAAYGGVRAVLALQYCRLIGLPAGRLVVRRRIIGLSLAAIVWASSAFLSAPERYYAWGVALLIDIGNSWTPVRITLALPPGAIHFPERFGLLTIILLGEFVASVMRGIESQPTWTLPAAAAAILSMAFGFALWSCYSDGAAGWEQRDLRSPRDVVRQRFWIVLHLLLFLGIGVVGVGARLAIAMGGNSSFSLGQAWIICIAGAVMMFSIVGIAATSGQRPRCSANWLSWIAVLIAGVTCLFGNFASQISGLVVIIGLLLVVLGETALLSLGRGKSAALEEI